MVLSIYLKKKFNKKIIRKNVSAPKPKESFPSREERKAIKPLFYNND
jgi:hypothetical protein